MLTVKAYELSTLTGTQVLLLVASETGHVYTFATPKLQPLITKPEGKNLIQACLNAPDNNVPVMNEYQGPPGSHHHHQPQQPQQHSGYQGYSGGQQDGGESPDGSGLVSGGYQYGAPYGSGGGPSAGYPSNSAAAAASYHHQAAAAHYAYNPQYPPGYWPSAVPGNTPTTSANSPPVIASSNASLLSTSSSQPPSLPLLPPQQASSQPGSVYPSLAPGGDVK